MRHTALLLLLCSCSSLSTAEAEQLALYQRNAKLYWEGDHLSQALGQIQLGLNLAPDDYLLNTLRGAILLRESGPSQGLEHQQLDEATAILAGDALQSLAFELCADPAVGPHRADLCLALARVEAAQLSCPAQAQQVDGLVVVATGPGPAAFGLWPGSAHRPAAEVLG